MKHVPLRLGVIAFVAAFVFWGCNSDSRKYPVSHSAALIKSAFNSAKLAEMDAAITNAIADKKCPGGVLWFEHSGSVYRKAFGNRAIVPAEEPMTEDTIFDAASLTKVCATTPAMLLLIERGQVKLDEPVATYIPEFAQNGKTNVTIRHLMTHTSGLPSGIRVDSSWSGWDGAIQKACATKLNITPGTMMVYSDINFFTLGEVVRRVSGQPLQDFVAKEIYGPLKMKDTGYLPPASKLSRIAPTEPDENGKMLRGVVHDPTSRHMGGVAGHAGLFTTASDLSRYAKMWLNGGELDGVRLLKAETVKLATTVQTPAGVSSRRGLGWDIDSPYAGPRGKLFPIGSFGHTGWTGTSVWMDPFSKTLIIFLSNRNHPDGKGNVIGLRSTLGTLAAEAITDFDFSTTPPAGALAPMPKRKEHKIVLNGIDVLEREHFIRLRGLKLGLITNHTGQSRDRNPTIDLLFNAPGVQLKCLFSPEHGIRGAVDEAVKDSVDEKTGLPVFSLYREVTPPRRTNESAAEFDLRAIRFRSPNEEQMKDIDALIFDLQDVGARFYTYSATLGGAIEAAGKFGKKIFVLDRVNPITGKFEGPIQTRPPSFIGFHSIPVRHGMTFGELGKMFNAERNFGANLQVVQVENWTHDMWYDETALPWRNPSPNMRSLNAATLYTGICLMESCKVSMGRGTDLPFEIFGAPYVDDVRFAWEMNSAGLPGVSFVPIRFTPTAIRAKPIAPGFAAASFVYVEPFVKKLAGKADPISAFLYDHLDPEIKQVLDHSLDKLPEKFSGPIATNLTKIIKQQPLYDEARFKNIKLRPETQGYLKKNPSGDDLARLNRLLIEDAFPLDFERNPKFMDLECGGVHCIITDRDAVNSVDIGIVAIKTLLRLYPDDFDVDAMGRLTGNDETVQAIEDGKSLEEIKKMWEPALNEFKKRREKYLIYQ